MRVGILVEISVGTVDFYQLRRDFLACHEVLDLSTNLGRSSDKLASTNSDRCIEYSSEKIGGFDSALDR